MSKAPTRVLFIGRQARRTGRKYRGGRDCGCLSDPDHGTGQCTGNQNSLGLVVAHRRNSDHRSAASNNPCSRSTDYMIDSVVLQPVVAPLPSTFGPGDQPYDPNSPQTTYLSTQKLSAAGLSNLQIAANTTLTVTADANISMNPGATLSLSARSIDFQGKIDIPSGTINLTAVDDVTSFPCFSSMVRPTPAT